MSSPKAAEEEGGGDVFSHLLALGEMYAQRRDLLQRKRDLLELQARHPHISAVAQALYESDPTRGQQSAAERLYALHREGLAQAARQREEQQQRQEEELRLLTFKPSINSTTTTTARSRAARRDVVKSMESWERERQRHVDEARRRATREEMQHMREVPQITAFAASCGHADRPQGLPVEDYLLLKEAERCERQFQRVEEQRRRELGFSGREGTSGGSSTARRRGLSSSSSRSRIPGVSKRASECIRQTQSTFERLYRRDRESSQTRAATPPSFKPATLSSSARMARRRKAFSADVFERLFSHTLETSSSPRRSASLHDPTFSPVIAESSRRLVEKQRAASAAHSANRSNSPGSRLHAEAERRRARLEKKVEEETSKRGDFFTPRISQHSERLTREQLKALVGEGAGWEDTCGLRWKQAQEYKQRQAELIRRQRDEEELRECTFRPQTSASGRRRQSSGGVLSVAERNEKWARRRESRLQDQRLLKELDELRECTFQPESTKPSPRASAESRRSARASSTAAEVAGLDAFLVRQEIARQRRRAEDESKQLRAAAREALAAPSSRSRPRAASRSAPPNAFLALQDHNVLRESPPFLADGVFSSEWENQQHSVSPLRDPYGNSRLSSSFSREGSSSRALFFWPSHRGRAPSTAAPLSNWRNSVR